MSDGVQRVFGGPFRKLRHIEKESMTQKIVRESLRVVILCSLISSFGGIGLELLQDQLLVLLPLLILFPALNEMMGGVGAIMISRFTCALYERKKISHLAHHVFRDVLGVTVITSLFVALCAYGIAWVKGFPFHGVLFIQILSFSLLVGMVVFGLLFCLSVYGSRYVFKQGHDPENYLIPLATAVGDLGSMLMLAIALKWFF